MFFTFDPMKEKTGRIIFLLFALWRGDLRNSDLNPLILFTDVLLCSLESLYRRGGWMTSIYMPCNIWAAI